MERDGVLVSIPSSSGHQFTGISRKTCPRRPSPPFQSLLHQGISLLTCLASCNCKDAQICFNPFFIRASVYCVCRAACAAISARASFQSLLHQGISLLGQGQQSRRRSVDLRFNPFFIRASVYCVAIATSPRVRFKLAFQSLLHQGISLLVANIATRNDWLSCFNPFFIRASVYCVRFVAPRTPTALRFNPFFIRASVYCERALGREILRHGRCFNPFFIRASVYWQCADFHHLPHSALGFNPFFIRASVYCMRLRPFQACLLHCVSIPSSSGHQFTGCASLPRRRHPALGFNPFFIRASVYWVSS